MWETAARAARSSPTESSPSRRYWAGKIRTTRQCGGGAISRNDSHARYSLRDLALPRIGDQRAAVAGEPQRHGDLSGAARLRLQALVHQRLEAGCGDPLRYRLRREAEAAMRKLLAQEFLLVRREIDDEQTPARAQHARRFLDGARAVVEEVQHLMQNDDVE